MGRSFVGPLVVGGLLSSIAATATANTEDEAVKKERKRIEGTWRVVALEVNGNKAMEEDAKKLWVINHPATFAGEQCFPVESWGFHP